MGGLLGPAKKEDQASDEVVLLLEALSSLLKLEEEIVGGSLLEFCE